MDRDLHSVTLHNKASSIKKGAGLFFFSIKSSIKHNVAPNHAVREEGIDRSKCSGLKAMLTGMLLEKNGAICHVTLTVQPLPSLLIAPVSNLLSSL